MSIHTRSLLLGIFGVFIHSVVFATTITRGPYLQLPAAGAITVHWTTDVPTDSRVIYSISPTTLDQIADDPSPTTDHAVRLTGLDTNTKYFYKVGTVSGPLSERYFFYTSPDDMHPLPTHFWFLGDAGADPTEAARVRDGYNTFRGSTYTPLMIFNGDMAYDNGTASEFKTKMFDVFNDHLHHSASVAALGEHDTGGSSNPPPGLPYFSIFQLFDQAQSGGIASGTENYYSFDYGTIHFVSLDSMASDRSASGPMLTWLQNDLANNQRPWLIAYWHHSPYSKGDHDSDLETEMSQMRAHANSILEDYGVDLIVGAHSHSYERSFLIDGHYGNSNSFKQSMILNGGDGRLDGDGAYAKTNDVPHAGTVYVVAGSVSKAVNAPLDYPAMYTSMAQPGSFTMDVFCAQLNATFVSDTGTSLDHFTKINKIHAAPTVTMTSPSDGDKFAAPATISFTATASSPNVHIRRVRFLHDGEQRIGTDYVAPYEVQWSNVKAGTYVITAMVEDELCGNMTTTPIQITVAPCTGPGVPSLLSPSNGQINVSTTPTLDWSDLSSATYDVQLCTDSSCATVLSSATGLTASQWTVTPALDTGTQYFWRARGRNTCGAGAWTSIHSFTTAGPPCIYCDDFEDSILSDQWQYLSGSWIESGGQLNGTSERKKTTAVAIPAFTGCTKCTVSTEMTTAGDQPGQLPSSVSLIGWYQNKANYVELLIKQRKGRVILKQRVAGRVVAKARASIAITPNTRFPASVVFDGTNFMAIINGTPLLTLPAAPGAAPFGSVGFRVKATTANFDNITVE